MYGEGHDGHIAACGAEFAPDILDCLHTTMLYCNAKPWDWQCRDLSVCGDGSQTWNEQVISLVLILLYTGVVVCIELLSVF